MGSIQVHGDLASDPDAEELSLSESAKASKYQTLHLNKRISQGALPEPSIWDRHLGNN